MAIKNEPNTSPFYRPLDAGTKPPIYLTAPFVPEPQEGEDLSLGRAYYTLQPQKLVTGAGYLDLDGALQIIPVIGETFEFPIYEIPFGNQNIKDGSTVTIYGVSDTTPPKMSNSRDKDYGLWLIGSATFYKGYTIQLQLVLMGTQHIWLEISRNF